MEFERDGERWVRIKQSGAWMVFAVTGPWLGSRFNVTRDDTPGNRYTKFVDAMASFKEHTQPKRKMNSYLSTGYHKFKL